MIAARLRHLNARLLPGRALLGPEWLVLGVNTICNLHCIMCDVGTRHHGTNFAANLTGSEQREMPVEVFERVADQAARHYPRARLGYAFTEPLLYSHLHQTLILARDRHLSTAITTNGLALPARAAEICDGGCVDLFLSLDGPEAVHNRLRGHPRAFQRALSGVEALLARPDRPRLSVFCVVTPWGVGHLEELARQMGAYPLERLGFLHLNFTPSEVAETHNADWGDRYPATSSNVHAVDPGAMEIDRLWGEIERLRALDLPFPVTFSPEIRSLEALEVYYRHPARLIGRRCNDVLSNLMVRPDGSVMPSHGRCYQLRLGNVLEAELPALWNSPQLIRFRRDLAAAGGLLPACSRCCSAF